MSSNNVTIGNTITTNKSDTGTFGFFLVLSSNNTFASNCISAGDTNAFAFSIYLRNNSSDNLFYNNYISAVIPASVVDISPNLWNTSKTAGTNIVGGPYIGGNVWINPSGTGFSNTCIDVDNDGICDSAYTLTFGNVDYLPLSLVIDSDNDGVKDSENQCPGTLPGALVDPNGCSQVQVD